MIDLATLESQSAVAASFVNGAPDRWERIVVNFEVAVDDAVVRTDYLAFAIVAHDDGLGQAQLRLTGAQRDAVVDLHERMAAAGDAWNSFDLTVDPPDRFRFQFSYDPAARLSGVLNDRSLDRFNRYLETYTAEKAAQR